MSHIWPWLDKSPIVKIDNEVLPCYLAPGIGISGLDSCFIHTKSHHVIKCAAVRNETRVSTVIPFINNYYFVLSNSNRGLTGPKSIKALPTGCCW